MRGSGLAQKMMELIIQTAAQQGYLSMSADILKTNTPMIKLLKNQDLPSRNRTPKKTCTAHIRTLRQTKQQEKQIKTCAPATK